MTNKEKLELAKECFDGDIVKAVALLKLLEIDPYECLMPNVTMEIPDND